MKMILIISEKGRILLIFGKALRPLIIEIFKKLRVVSSEDNLLFEI